MSINTYIQALVELLLLFINYAKAEVYFVGFFKTGLHPHNLRKGFFGMLKGAIAIVKDSNAIPKLGLLDYC